MTWADFKRMVEVVGVVDVDVLAFIDWRDGMPLGAFRFEAPDGRVGQVAIDESEDVMTRPESAE